LKVLAAYLMLDLVGTLQAQIADTSLQMKSMEEKEFSEVTIVIADTTIVLRTSTVSFQIPETGKKRAKTKGSF
jgi:hypothetical protein